MNPVLKKAGVVDAGGKGYLVILEGMLAGPAGRGDCRMSATAKSPRSKADFSALSEEEITFTFDTVFIVRKWENTSIEPLRAYLSTIGDCLVIGEDDDAFKVHVHTDIPGAALTEAQKYGTLELAKIENMRTQYEAVAAGRKAQSTDDLDAGGAGAGEHGGACQRSGGEAATASCSCAPAKGWPPRSGIWAWTESCPADRP